MAAKPTRAPAKKKQPAAVETSLSIAEQTKAFLKSGGAIEAINSGVSGQQSMAGPKHITLGNNKPQAQNA
ncbi:MAG: hypothetical protein WCY88_06950 [Spongiibacteraceae bacterium]